MTREPYWRAYLRTLGSFVLFALGLLLVAGIVLGFIGLMYLWLGELGSTIGVLVVIVGVILIAVAGVTHPRDVP